MERKTIKRDIIRAIKTGEEEIEIWETLDGKQFDSKDSAMQHENYRDRFLKFGNIIKKDFTDDFCYADLEDTVWYYLKSKEEKNILKEFKLDPKDNIVNEYDIELNTWFTFYISYEDFRHKTYEIVKLDQVKKEIDKFLSMFREVKDGVFR